MNLAGVFKRYHINLARTFYIGEPHRDVLDLCNRAVHSMNLIGGILRPNFPALSDINAHKVFEPGTAVTWASVSLDGLRGAAAVLVLVFHWRNLFFVSYHEIGTHRWLFFAPYTLTAGGHEAVMIFFVLSGYLIGGTVHRSMASNQWSWASYLTHRLVRLWIVLVPGLLLCLLWDMILYWGIDSSHSFHFSDPALPQTLRGLNTDTAAAFFGTLFFLQNVMVPAFGSDAALWSLANEFWYYILFPLGLLSIRSSTPLRTRILTAGLFLLLCLWLGKPLLALFPVWLLGAAVVVMPRARLSDSIRWLALAGYVPIIFLCTYLKPRLHMGSDFITGGATAALIWTMLSATQAASRSSLVPRLCRGLARFSYTLYVVHAPFLLLFASLLVGTAPWQPTWSPIAIGLGVLALTIGYAYGVAALTEFHTDSVRVWVERRLGLEVRRSGQSADPRLHL